MMVFFKGLTTNTQSYRTSLGFPSHSHMSSHGNPKRFNGIQWDLLRYMMDIPSGKHSQFANWKVVIEIVDLPINKMVIFHIVF